MKQNINFLVFLIFFLLPLYVLSLTNDYHKTINEIKTEVLKVHEKEYPLPLVGGWNAGEKKDGYTPDFQRQMIEKGHRILPWFYLGSPIGKQLDDDYYIKTIKWAAKYKLPISFRSTQFEHMLSDDEQYYEIKTHDNPNFIDKKGVTHKKLSPFATEKYWEDIGERWSNLKILKKIQKIYPNPPKIIFLSNNEHKKIRFNEIKKDIRFKQDSTNNNLKHLRKTIQKKWQKKYSAFFKSFKNGFLNDNWKNNSIFVGYHAIHSPKIGKYFNWNKNTLYIPGDLDPWANIWNGTSAPYYVRNSNKSSDFTRWSPQIESMNWHHIINNQIKNDTGYWFELSIWDGGEQQRNIYKKKGQIYNTDRYQGFVQFGTWLHRPRLIREFLYWDQKTEKTKQYFDVVLEAVDRVYDVPELSKFWRYGKLVSNDKNKHPYNINIPDYIKKQERWFMLDSSLNNDDLDNDDDIINVYSIALSIIEGSKKEWLVYAYSPLNKIKDVKLMIPGHKNISIDTQPSGDFYIIQSKNNRLLKLNKNKNIFEYYNKK